MQDNVWQRKDNWVGSQIEDAFVMLNFEGGEYVSLNSTATEIWNALETPCRIDEIVSNLTARYAISTDECTSSVNRIIVELADKGLIQQSQ